MIGKGRPRLPREVRKRRGTYRASEDNLNTPQLIRKEFLDYPPLVEANVDARGQWDRMCKILGDMGVLTEAESPALELFCLAYSRFKECEKAIQKEGFCIEGRDGMRRNPTLITQRDSVLTMEKMLSHFGCTPATRSKVDAQEAEEEPDELEKLMMGRPSRHQS